MTTHGLPISGAPAAGTRLLIGQAVPVRIFATVTGSLVDVGFDPRPVHIQFRRFAGCPVCSLHLRSFVKHRNELEPLVRELILFHSTSHALRRHAGDIPFSMVADPDKRLYRAFGVEAAPRALLSPRVWPGILRAVLASLAGMLLQPKPLPPLVPEGGRLGLPADFLISPEGRILDCHYGTHADDQWSVDEVLARARQFG